MAEVEIPEQFAGKLRSALADAAHDPSGPWSSARWTSARDEWIDLVEPGARMVDPARVGDLLDLFADSVPSARSRATRDEWSALIDSLTPRILGLARPVQPN